MRSIVIRRETLQMRGIRSKLRVLHLSDTHFSPALSYERNVLKGKPIMDAIQAEKPDIIALTGDLISRTADAQSFRAAWILATHLCSIAPVLFSLGNHESDLPEQQKREFLDSLRKVGVEVLDNAAQRICDVDFVGLTLPGTVYKNEKGGYSGLTPITTELVKECVGNGPARPCILLAHSPMGFPAYAEWGADLILSGHVHGGIIRLGKIGFLSPERRFLPRYTKGVYRLPECVMNVSAGIGKLRWNNPAEVVCLDLLPAKEGYDEYSTAN